MTMQGRKVDFNSFETRIEFMQNSFSVFTKAPMLGIYGRTELMTKYGYLLRDHNVWVDMLAYHGILRTLPIVIFYITWYKNTVKNKDYSYSYAVFCVSMFCILCGFFNPINKPVVQLVMFIIVPISDVLVNSDKKTNKNLLNDKYKIKILREE